MAAGVTTGRPATGSGRVGRPEDMTEKHWSAQVVDLARQLGWATYHPYLSVRSAPGWPDLALVKPPRLVFAELKSERGSLTEAQTEWLGLLDACLGVEVYVWRPSDLEEVALVLGRGDTAEAHLRVVGELEAAVRRHPASRPA